MTTNPYVGLTPFRVEDEPYYFGRESDARILVTNFYGSPTTVVHGTGGVGKTSLIHAAVIPKLRARGVQVVTFERWETPEPIEALRQRVVESIPLGDDRPDSTSLIDILRDRRGQLPVLIVFEQFEEYFLYHDVNEKAGGDFAHAIGDITNDASPPAHFFFVVREDAVGRLSTLLAAIPSVMSNLILIDDLPADALREAIARPLEQFNRVHQTAYGIEPQLIDEIMVSVSGTTAAPGRKRVNLPFLQLALSQLWERESEAGGLILRRETLAAIGGLRGLFERGVFDTLDSLSPIDRTRVADFVGYLVTPSGVRIAQTEADLAIFAECPVEDVQRLLDVLAQRRLVSISEASSEGLGRSCRVTYDEIAAALLDWRRRFGETRQMEQLKRERELESHLAAEQRHRAENSLLQQERSRRRHRLGIMFVLIFGIALVAVFYRVVQRQRALAQAATETGQGWRLLQQNRPAEALDHCAAAVAIYRDLGRAALGDEAEQCDTQARQAAGTGATPR